MSGTVIVLLVLAAIVAYAISLYNKLVKNKNLVDEGWSGIETQLKRRANLIPNLVETVKGYATHEREALEAVARLEEQSADVLEAILAED